MKIASTREIRFSPNENCIRVKYDLRREYGNIKILKNNVSVKQIINWKFKNAYSDRLPLTQKKSEDIKKMLDRHIPDDEKNWYEKILEETL